MKNCNFCAQKYESVHTINESIEKTTNQTVTILEGLKIFNNELQFLINSDAVICANCLERLRDCYDFVQQIMESKNKLRLKRDIQNEHDYSETDNINKNVSKSKELILTNLKLGLEVSKPAYLLSQFPETQTETKPKDAHTNLRLGLDNSNLKFIPILPKTSNVQRNDTKCTKGTAIAKSRLYKCLECTQTFKSFKHLREHEQKACTKVSLDGVFVCKHCHACFNSENFLKAHQTEKHADNQYLCYFCKDKLFTAKGYLIRHMDKIHQLQRLPYFCGECKDITLLTTPNELNQHFTQNHQLNKLKDDSSQQNDLNNDDDDEHMDLEMHEEFLDEFLLAHTNENSFQFSECWEALDLHLPDMLQENATNQPNNPDDCSEAFSCPKCFEQFKNPQPLLQHLAENHNMPVLICRTCHKSFASLKDFKIHKEIKCHLNSTIDSPNLNCPYCSKTFKNTLNLKQHLRIVHTQLKRHVCQLCDKQFSTLDHLKKHVLSQHQNERKHLCDVCEKTFTQLVHLKQHLAIHTTGKTLQCPGCSKKFWRKIDLERHNKKKHAGASA